MKDDIDVSPQLRLWWTLVRTKRLMHKIRNKELKQAVFAELDKLVKKDAILASNSSAQTHAEIRESV